MKKRILCFVLAVLLILPSLVVSAAEATTLMYAKDGRIISVPNSKVSAYKAVGWFTQPVEPTITKKTDSYTFGDGVLQSFEYLRSTDKLSELFNLSTAYVGGADELGARVFENCKQLTRVELSDTITQIGYAYSAYKVFYNTSLTRIGIPNSVKRISYKAFKTLDKDTYEETNLKNLVIYCGKGSEAEKFAKNYNIKYVYATMIYCIDGKTMMVDDKEKAVYLSSGLWNTTPLIQMYTLDGRTKLVHRDKVKLYKEVGWYDDKSVVMTTIYAADGRTKQIFKKDLAAYKKVGWYDAPPVLMYAADGRTKYVSKNDVAAYKKVGWYDKKSDVLVTMYAADGRTKQVFKGKVAAEKKVGWFDAPPVLMYTADGRTKYVSKNDVAAYKKVGWFEKK